MSMELHDLKIFVSLAEDSSATAAARRLGMTQPGVSQHIAKLEEEIGYRLFDRSGKRLDLNDNGMRFLEKAKKLLADAYQLANPGEAETCPIGVLKLGLTDSATLTVIPPVLVEFRKLYAGVHIRLDVDDSNDIEHGLLRGHYDLGVVTAGEKTHPMLDEEILYYDRIDVIVGRQHPLARKKRVSLGELAKWPLLVYPRRSRTRQIVDDGFHAKKIFPRDVIDVYTNSAAVKLAEVGVGAALLSRTFITSEMQKHKCAHIRIVGDPFAREICVARKRDMTMSEPARFFYEMLKKKSAPSAGK